MWGLRLACATLMVLLVACERNPKPGAGDATQPALAAHAARVEGRAVGLPAAAPWTVAPPAPAPQPALGPFGFRPPRQLLRPTDDGPGRAIVETLATLDIDGDGRPDLVTMSAQGLVDVYLQTPAGQLVRRVTVRSTTGDYSPDNSWLLGEFNGDGIDDFVFRLTGEHGVHGGVGLLLSRQGGLPVFREAFPPTVYMAADGISEWVVLDEDGDGHQDIVLFRNFVDVPSTPLPCGSEICPNYEVLYGDGTGSLGRPVLRRLPFDQMLREATVIDLDGDGLEDIVASALAPGSPEDDVALFASYGNGGPPLQEWHYVHPLGSLTSVVFADLDGNGRADTIHGATIRFQEAARRFSDEVYLASYYHYPYVPHVADFDHDGRGDLVNHQYTDFGTIPFLAVYLGTGGDFRQPFTLDDPPWPHGFNISIHRHAYASADFNADGCTDLAIAVNYDGVAILDGYNCLPWPHRMAGPMPRRKKR